MPNPNIGFAAGDDVCAVNGEAVDTELVEVDGVILDCDAVSGKSSGAVKISLA